MPRGELMSVARYARGLVTCWTEAFRAAGRVLDGAAYEMQNEKLGPRAVSGNSARGEKQELSTPLNWPRWSRRARGYRNVQT